MRAVSLSLQPPSGRKRIGTLAWKSGTAFIRNTVSRATKATPRQITWKRYACTGRRRCTAIRSEEHTSELQSPYDLVCRILLVKKKIIRQKAKTKNITKKNKELENKVKNR